MASFMLRLLSVAKKILLKRWIADRMITKRSSSSALVEADIAHRFVIPKDSDVTSKVKSYTMNDFIHHLVTEIAREEEFTTTKLQPDLAQHLSAHAAVQVQQAMQQLNMTYSKGCWNLWNHFNQTYPTKIDKSNATMVFLESLPSSNYWGLLEMLDLEGCKELEDHHLKNICNHLFQLKYLNLRCTDITELPKQLNKLQYLETLDIRQTRVRAFPQKYGILPKLKHLLAGHQNECISQDRNQSEEPFVTLQMPKGNEAMTELQVLSHVTVSKTGSDFMELGSPVQLRKLGVVIQGPQERVFMHLYHTIGKLSRSLRTLSIQIIDDNENAELGVDVEERLLMPPKYLQKLEISGLTVSLPVWVKDLKELKKTTLHKTLLTAADIEIIGTLTSLYHLWLRREACSEQTLNFSKDGFHCLKFLVIECPNITSINFGDSHY